MKLSSDKIPPVEAVDLIDAACDEFEASWLRNERPSIADYLSKVGAVQRVDLFRELLFVDVEYRVKVGESPKAAEYRIGFPEYAGEIERASFEQFGPQIAIVGTATVNGSSDSTHCKGKRIGHFELLERLGSGAMAEVWKAWDPRLQRAVALKLPHNQALSDAELKRFLREAQATAQLRHPQLSTIHEAGRDGGTAYLVSDFFEGRNLKEHLAAHTLSFVAIAEVCAEIAEALHYAHQEGVVHRDLKPANIIIDNAGRPHVIDFGLAKWQQDDRELTVHGEVMGTPAYMSPEQARGEGGKADRRTDIYSLGVILYELLCGQCPFNGDRSNVMQQIASAEPLPPRAVNRKVPRDLETICLKALEKPPQRRYATAQEMAVDLRRFVRGEPILARRVGLLEKGWRFAKRRPGWAAAFVLAAIATAATRMWFSTWVANLELMGSKSVSFTTEPAGATVVFARLNEFGELLPGEITKPAGVTPVRADLLPGNYFVEVLWPDGRFHQVFRHLPAPSEPYTSNRYKYKSTSWLRGQGNSISWPVVTKTNSASFDEMKLVTRHGFGSSRQDFYVDTAEVSGELIRHIKKWKDSPPDIIKPTSFAFAAEIAEATGARLPTKREYELLRGGLEQEVTARVVDERNVADALLYAEGIVPGQAFRRVRSAEPLLLH